MEKLAAVPKPAPEVREQVLAADGATGLPRRPGGERAPVRAIAGASRDGRGEARVAVRDLEVADGRVRDPGDSPDLVDVWRRGHDHWGQGP